jgi:hypothetical protein
MRIAVRNQASIPGDLREMIILRVVVLNRASFEFDVVRRLPNARAWASRRLRP